MYGNGHAHPGPPPSPPPLPAGAAVLRQSAMAAPGVSKAEYLRRYLSGPAEPAQPRRRRKKKPPGGTGRAG